MLRKAAVSMAISTVMKFRTLCVCVFLNNMNTVEICLLLILKLCMYIFYLQFRKS